VNDAGQTTHPVRLLVIFHFILSGPN